MKTRFWICSLGISILLVGLLAGGVGAGALASNLSLPISPPLLLTSMAAAPGTVLLPVRGAHLPPGTTLPQRLGNSCGPTRDEVWQIETVDDDLNVGRGSSLALDSLGRPHISYCEWNSPRHTLRYASYDGTDWYTETVDSPEVCYYDASLALDSEDRPHISYCALGEYGSDCDELRYARYDGSAWITETVDSGSDVGVSSSLVLDAQGRPRIGYSCDPGLCYTAWDGTAWNRQVLETGPYVGGAISLVLDSFDRPHISYWSNFDLMYAAYDGETWSIEVVGGMGEGTFTSLALDSAGWPHIAYQLGDWHYFLDLWHASYDGLDWYTEQIQHGSFLTDVGSSGSLALDTSDRPRIAYSYANTLQPDTALYYAWYDGTAWQFERVEEGSRTGYKGISLALDGASRAHISYNSQSCLRYAHQVPCVPVGGVALSGPVRLPVGLSGLYSTAYTPPSATLPITLSWSNGAVGSTAAYSWTVAGTHTVAVTATGPCSGTGAALTVTVFCQPLEGVTLSEPPTRTVGQEGLYQVAFQPLTASRPLILSWDNGSLGPSAVYSWTMPGLYTVSVTATNVCAGAAVGRWVVQVEPYCIYLPLVLRE